MTPEQKLKWEIVNKAHEFEKTNPPEVTSENIDSIYEELVISGDYYDAKEDIRCSGHETGIYSGSYSNHYENESVAAQMPDGTWVGWDYWHGGGKHGNPWDIDWMEDSYDVAVVEEEKLMVVRTFSKIEKQA
jgi:hypothetical protein